MVAIQYLAGLVFASMALAIPSSRSRHEARAERRSATRQGQPNKKISSSAAPTGSNASHVSYSDNWAGAVWDSYPSVSFDISHIDCH